MPMVDALNHKGHPLLHRHQDLAAHSHLQDRRLFLEDHHRDRLVNVVEGISDLLVSTTCSSSPSDLQIADQEQRSGDGVRAE